MEDRSLAKIPIYYRRMGRKQLIIEAASVVAASRNLKNKGVSPCHETKKSHGRLTAEGAVSLVRMIGKKLFDTNFCRCILLVELLAGISIYLMWRSIHTN